MFDHFSGIVFLYFAISWPGIGSQFEGVMQIIEIFRSHQLVPALLPYVPERICSITFRPNSIIMPGKPYYGYQTDHEPEITWKTKPDKYYTLYSVGVVNVEFIYPDKMIRCKFLDFPRSQWIQWLVTNIPGTDIAKGDVIFPFANFSEPAAEVRQAYVFVILEQEKQKPFPLKEKDNKRHSFRHENHDFTPISKFMKKNPDLKIVEANFFYLTVPETTTKYFDQDMLDQTPPIFVYNNISR